MVIFNSYVKLPEGILGGVYTSSFVSIPRERPHFFAPDRLRRGSTHLQSSSVGAQSSKQRWSNDDLMTISPADEGWADFGEWFELEWQILHFTNLPCVCWPFQTDQPIVEWLVGSFTAETSPLMGYWSSFSVLKLQFEDIPNSQTKPYSQMDGQLLSPLIDKQQLFCQLLQVWSCPRVSPAKHGWEMGFIVERLGPIKIKLGECFGGSGNNDNLRLLAPVLGGLHLLGNVMISR